MKEFRPELMLKVLRVHGVSFVIIGGFAGNIHGSPLITTDLDICHERSEENLDRLASALVELGAALDGSPRGGPQRPDLSVLQAVANLRTTTDGGGLDLFSEPYGTKGYAELLANAEEVDALGEVLLVCALEDLVRMRRASGRPIDLLSLTHLDALLEQIEERRRRD